GESASGAGDTLVLLLPVGSGVVKRDPVDVAEVLHDGALCKLLPDRGRAGILSLELGIGQVRECEHAVRGAKALKEDFLLDALSLDSGRREVSHLLECNRVSVCVEVTTHYQAPTAFEMRTPMVCVPMAAGSSAYPKRVLEAAVLLR